MKHAVVLLLVLCIGCIPPNVVVGGPAPVIRRADIPNGSQVGVIMFRNCIEGGEKSCNESGNVVGNIFLKKLEEIRSYKTIAIPKPGNPYDELSDEAAIQIAKNNHVEYIVTGNVDVMFNPAVASGLYCLAGVTIKVIRVSDGFTVVTFRERRSDSNASNPTKMMNRIAKYFTDKISTPMQ